MISKIHIVIGGGAISNLPDQNYRKFDIPRLILNPNSSMSILGQIKQELKIIFKLAGIEVVYD